MHSSTSIRLALVFLAALAVGCDQDGPRELPFPTIDTSAPFPELHATGASGAASSGKADKSSFENAIEESMDEQDQDDDARDAPTVKRQDVPLTGTLITSMPLEFDEWQWSSEGDVTIITHRRPGADHPDALVYAEGFSGLVRMFPSLETRRFQRTVDPELGRTFSVPALTDKLLDELSDKTGLAVSRLTDALAGAVSHTMGLGLNYRSDRSTFTGWQWIGHNDHRVELRLGRTTGEWRTRSDADATLGDVFSQASDEVDALSGVQERYEQVLADQDRRPDNGAPAWMIHGSAVTDGEQGLHIAVLCKTSPGCPVAAELSELLADIRPADSSTVNALKEQGASADLPEFAAEQGVPFLDADDILDPTDVDAVLKDGLAN